MGAGVGVGRGDEDDSPAAIERSWRVGAMIIDISLSMNVLSLLYGSSIVSARDRDSSKNDPAVSSTSCSSCSSWYERSSCSLFSTSCTISFSSRPRRLSSTSSSTCRSSLPNTSPLPIGSPAFSNCSWMKPSCRFISSHRFTCDANVLLNAAWFSFRSLNCSFPSLPIASIVSWADSEGMSSWWGRADRA